MQNHRIRQARRPEWFDGTRLEMLSMGSRLRGNDGKFYSPSRADTYNNKRSSLFPRSSPLASSILRSR